MLPRLRQSARNQGALSTSDAFPRKAIRFGDSSPAALDLRYDSAGNQGAQITGAVRRKGEPPDLRYTLLKNADNRRIPTQFVGDQEGLSAIEPGGSPPTDAIGRKSGRSPDLRRISRASRSLPKLRNIPPGVRQDSHLPIHSNRNQGGL